MADQPDLATAPRPETPHPTPPEPRRTTLWRWLVPSLVVLLWLLVGGPLGSFTGQLSSVQENDALSFLPATAESTEVAKAEAAFVNQENIPAIVVYEFEKTLTREDLAAISIDVDSLKDVPGVGSDVVGPVASEDQLAATVVLNIANTSDSEPNTAVEDVRALLDDSPALALGADIYATGPAGFLADFSEAFGQIDGLLLLVTLGVVLIILLIVYRSPVLPIFVLLTSLLALGAAAAVIYLLASNSIITLNGQGQGILFILVIGATTDYSLLLVSRYREELRRYPNPVLAMRATLKGTFEAILASSGTVILGVLTLLLSELNSNRGLGPVAAVGVFFAMFAALTFLPAVLLLLGRGAFWPVQPHYRPDQTENEADTSQDHGIWTKIANFVGRKPRAVWIGSLVFLLALSAFLPAFKASGVAQSDFFLTTVESTEGQDALERHFPAGSGSETIVIGPANDLNDIVAVIDETPGVAGAVPATESGNPATAEPLVANDEVLIRVTLSDAADSSEAEDTVILMREELDQAAPGALVGGPTATQVDTQASSQRDLRVIIPAVLIVTLLVLMALLRSIVAPVLLIGTVIVSFTATLGLSAIVFYSIMDLPGADASVPLFAFVFLAALGIDYNIFLMTRAREETKKSGTRVGILRALAVTGGVITSAGVVLAATFSALAILPLLFLFQIAFIVAVGVLIDTLIVRSLLVPAVVYELGDKTWWPSKLSKAGPAPESPPDKTPVSTP